MRKKTQMYVHVILKSLNTLTVNSSLFSCLTVEILCFDQTATTLVRNGKQNLGLSAKTTEGPRSVGRKMKKNRAPSVVLVLSPGCCYYKAK